MRYFYLGIRYLGVLREKSCKNIFYIYGYPVWENILFIVVARYYGYRIIFDIVEDYRFPDSYSSPRSKIKTVISLFFFRRLGILAHGCIGISHHLVDLCRQMSNGKIPVELISGSIDLDVFRRLSVATNNTQEFIFYYGGNFAEKDGIDLMIRAFELVASRNSLVKLVLTGEGDDRHMRTLFQLIETSPAKPQIEYLGFLNREQYLTQLASADVLLMLRINSPFANAGFPFKLGEYLASGKPVIASKVGDVEKYLQHNENALLVEPGNIDQITSAMFYCLTHKSKVKDIGKNGRIVAEKWFDAIKHSRKLLNFLERV
jgi:glycosyltransferase involved in cell wall biosynthesis